MEKLKKVISWPVILGIQVIATLIILFSIFKLNILPTTYAVMVGMILVFIKKKPLNKGFFIIFYLAFSFSTNV